MTPGPSTIVAGTSQEQQDIHDYYNSISYQPATVDPSTLLRDPGPSSAAQNFTNYYSPDPYYGAFSPFFTLSTIKTLTP